MVFLELILMMNSYNLFTIDFDVTNWYLILFTIFIVIFSVFIKLRNTRKRRGIKSIKNILLTGQPKAGKSYTLSKLIESFQKNKNIKIKGMLTNELTFAGTRVGIKIKDIKKEEEELFAIKFFKNDKYNPSNLKTLGNYQIDTEALDRIALPIFNNLENCNLLIIDEIGRMELESEKFKKEIEKVFNISKSENFVILATVPIKDDVNFVEELKNRNDTELIELSRENRDDVFKNIFNKINEYVS